MSVVDLATGAPITEPIEKPSLLGALRTLVGRIESGELDVERFYLIAECSSGKTHSFDNDLTASDAIVMLEREKFHILCVLQGIEV